MADTRRLGGPGFDVVEAARDAITRYAMLEGGETIVVAVSGGPDSTCLLDVLARLATTEGYELVVAHVDHGLSEQSEAVAARVAKEAAEAGFDVHVARAHDLAGPNLHARARDFRYGFFETIAQDVGASRIATGHTLDDRVETTIARLVHGAGTDGLAGIPPIAAARIRPLITTRRSATRDYCTERKLESYEDPGNDDERFDRAVVRNKLIPIIEERWGRGATAAIASAADDLKDDADALALMVDRVYKDLVRGEEGSITIDRDTLVQLPRALRRRVLERAIGPLRDRSGGISAALAALDRGSSGQRFAVASGIEIHLGPKEVRLDRMRT
jgi:tRNA(Ile)-lysidine synthase